MTFSGQNSSTKVTCFSIFVDSISKKIWTEFQSSTDAAQTLQGKHRVEKNGAQFNVTVKAYRGDNGVFRSKEFQDDIDKKINSSHFVVLVLILKTQLLLRKHVPCSSQPQRNGQKSFLLNSGHLQ
jgi:hypothetical protein